MVVIAGCTTPSVPIPPPSPDNIYFALDGDNGQATFHYDPDPSYGDAIVYVFNRDAGEGIITRADADGRVQESNPFPALVGDKIVVTFEVEAQTSSTCVLVQEGQSSSASECEL